MACWVVEFNYKIPLIQVGNNRNDHFRYFLGVPSVFPGLRGHMTRNMQYYFKIKYHCNISQILSQNAPDCISACIHFKTFPGGMPLDPPPPPMHAPGGNNIPSEQEQTSAKVNCKKRI